MCTGHVRRGELLAFGADLTGAGSGADAVVWRGRMIDALLAAAPCRGTHSTHGTHGALVLAQSATGHVATAPGLSLVVQVLHAGDATEPHRHAHWHLYIVKSGGGEARLGRTLRRKLLQTGDVLFVPEGCPHALANSDAREPFVLLRLQPLCRAVQA